MRRQPLIVCDVAHNPDAILKLSYSVQQLFPKRGMVVFGVMKDKNIDEMLLVLKKLNLPVIAVQPKTERALSSKEIVHKCHSLGISCFHGGEVQNGVNFGLSRISKDEFLLVCGSFYVAAELKKI